VKAHITNAPNLCCKVLGGAAAAVGEGAASTALLEGRQLVSSAAIFSSGTRQKAKFF
jgi:hypothetical protein